MAYFIKRNDKVNGPFTDGQIESGVKSGKLKNADLIGKSENGPWQPIKQVLAASPKSVPAPLPSDDVIELQELDVVEYDELQPLADHGFALPQQPALAPNYMPATQTKPCPFCAEQIAAAAIKCKHCGEMLNNPPALGASTTAATFSPAASGAQQIGSTNSRTSKAWKRNFQKKLDRGKSKTTAAILAFFLGGLGAHKFYLGTWGWGIIYILFVFTFIPAIVSLIEFIIFLTTSKEEFDAKWNHSDPSPFDW